MLNELDPCAASVNVTVKFEHAGSCRRHAAHMDRHFIAERGQLGTNFLIRVQSGLKLLDECLQFVEYFDDRIIAGELGLRHAGLFLGHVAGWAEVVVVVAHMGFGYGCAGDCLRHR